MRRLLVPFTLALAAVALLAPRVVAHEGGSGISVRAPLDAVDCATTPPTITVLGLTIDVGTATIDAGGDDEGDDVGHGDGDLVARHDEKDGGDDGEGDDDGDDDGADGGCAALVVGQPIRIVLASDTVPLVATKVEQDSENEGVEIKAPLQAVDSAALTITLLGVTIDVSTATLDGSDGESDGQPLDLARLMLGESAEVHLDATQLPALVASELEARIFAVKLRAPLDAVDCTTTPPTITVLGLTIDIATAAIDAGGGGDGDLVARHGEEDGGDDGEGDGDDDDEGDGGSGGGCTALVVGRLVRIVLASDATPLVATKVKQHGEDEGVEIEAPLQAVDATAHTIVLLGLTIDAGSATLGGDDGDDDDGGQPIDFTQLMRGQFAEVHLDAMQLPALVATELEVTALLGGTLDVELDDPGGTEIDDPSADLTVDVTTTVRGAAVGKRGKISKTLHFRAITHGSFRLSGLPAGSAKINVAGVYGGVTMARSKGARMKGNRVRSLRLRLRRVH